MNVSKSIQVRGRDEESGPSAFPGARAPRSHATRRRLLDAGRTLFAERGPRAVTTHAIAAKAGYASGTFYLHFKDKLALFHELAEEAAAELEARLDHVAEGRTDPAEITLAQAEALVGFAEDQRDLLRIVFHPGGEAGEIGPKILERLARGLSVRRQEAACVGEAESGAEADDRFDPDVLSQAIVGMWAHVLAWWAEDPTRVDRDAIIRTLTHFQLYGGCADSDPSRRSAVPLSNPLITSPQGDSAR